MCVGAADGHGADGDARGGQRVGGERAGLTNLCKRQCETNLTYTPNTPTSHVHTSCTCPLAHAPPCMPLHIRPSAHMPSRTFGVPHTHNQPCTQGVTTRRRDARRAVKRLLGEHSAVLVGHGLHNDLVALRLDARVVIDTALLFTYQGVVWGGGGGSAGIVAVRLDVHVVIDTALLFMYQG
eukprot:366429-Chlamydomonas_euryale.AAC.12